VRNLTEEVLRFQRDLPCIDFSFPFYVKNRVYSFPAGYLNSVPGCDDNATGKMFQTQYSVEAEALQTLRIIPKTPKI
jgi:hypothetical protein